MANITVLVNGNTKVSLGQKEYKAQGGEGTVYVKNNMAYKIYHEPTKMIPEGKLIELQKIQTENVLAPCGVLYDAKYNKPIGFVMPFVDNTEYLTKLFSSQFKTTNGISIDTIIALVTKMQTQLESLHKETILVGDYNEMNFLIDSTFTIPYHIDVDSYQTKSFPCTAIMDSIRDRRLPFGKFDELSDWFSWAVVTFQMYTGIHPYKGKHPKYKTTELDDRMKNNISVFDSDVRIPKSCQNFDLIPKNQLDWYKKVFVCGERSMPPMAGACGIINGFIPAIVTGTNGFDIDLIYDYGDTILDVIYYNQIRYVVTPTAIFCGINKDVEFKSTQKSIKLANVLGYDPIIAVQVHEVIKFFDFSKCEIGEVSAREMMISNGNVYTVSSNGDIIENYFVKMGKIQYLSRVVGQVASTYKIFDGVIIQNIFGKFYASIPYESRKCIEVEIPELNGYRVLDAKRINNVMIVIGEKNGKYDRFVIFFNATFTAYDVRVNTDVAYMTVNFMRKQNGLIASIINDDTLEMFVDNKRGTKEINDCPADLEMSLYDGLDRVLFANGTKLYELKTN